MSQENFASNLNLKWISFQQQKFLSNPWWTRQLFDADKEFEKLSAYSQQISKLRQDNEKKAKEMDQVLCAMYIHEAWANECMNGPTNDTFELTACFLEENKEQFDRRCKKLNLEPKRTYKKMTNLLAAIRDYGGITEQAISPNLIMAINQTLMNGLMENAGIYRTKDAKPSGSHFLYCRSEQIERRLTVLVEFFQKEVSSLANGLELILLATLFFSEFLMIHPFSNGNGRTARILLSLLLRTISVVPFSLSLSSGRKVYLDCLTERMNEEPPTQLASLILSETRQFSWNIYYLFCMD